MYELTEVLYAPDIVDLDSRVTIAFIFHDLDEEWWAMIEPVGICEDIEAIVNMADPEVDAQFVRKYLDGMAQELDAMESWEGDVLPYLRLFVNSIQIGDTKQLDSPFFDEFDLRDEWLRLGKRA